jgi:hypothetical protein
MSYKPEFPYNKEQIILNSDRIILNSKNDSIFLSSNKIINLSSNLGIHLNTKDIIHLNGSKLLLGLNANEPVPKGLVLNNFLTLLLDELSNTSKLLSTAIDSNLLPIINVNIAGENLQKSIIRLKILQNRINSDITYTL